MKSFVAVIVYLFYFQCLPISQGQQTFVIDGREVDIDEAPYMVKRPNISVWKQDQ